MNDTKGAGPAKGADYGFVRSVQDLDHSAYGAAPARAPLHTDNHLVAVHRRLQGEAGHEDILPTLVGRNEAVALLGNGDAAHDEVDLFGKGETLPFHTVETAPFEHTAKDEPEIPKIPRRNGQPFRDFLRLHWAPT